MNVIMDNYKAEMDCIFECIQSDLDTSMEEIDLVMEKGNLSQEALYMLNDVKNTLQVLKEKL